MRSVSRPRSAWRRTRRVDIRSRRAWTRVLRSSKTHITRSARRTAANPGRSDRKTGSATTFTSSRIRSATFRQDLPRRYYLELPKLADGPFEGYPRVYVLARELVTHTAGRFDLQTLIRFLRRVSARCRALDRRNLGDPDHAAARAGGGAAHPRKRRRRSAPQSRACAPLGSGLRGSDDRSPRR